MTEYSEDNNYSNVNDPGDENDEEEGLVEYLEIDSEVMETLQSPNEYFTQVNQPHQGQIYVHQSDGNTQQLSLVIKNSPVEFSSLKEMSPQQFDNHNGVTNILWSNSTINSSDDSKASEKTGRNSRKSTKSSNNHKGERKRKTRDSDCSDNNLKYVNQKDIIMAKEQIQSDDSLDLFFQSMAHTVSHLPSEIQAKIKMEICKVISMAEIKYCSQNTTSQNNLNEDFNHEN
ncbi:hypothetical protein PV325_012889 [Microctonus aethiopoides]|uniref:BESS domain-containing protein n=1 Tax=Microctonus aethiopoides TaxID=144406 RepID=A0AA39F9B9_9HYME|nr:hypothetical protein PV325_012889 [Microctonus aethiopoides]KAK0091144.1 hypothetical protein PV326_003675 [Microctonus aethiopoides]KAK0165352.1 hypothetical protein PV328_003871 [Microctonus aethiopoides]